MRIIKNHKLLCVIFLAIMMFLVITIYIILKRDNEVNNETLKTLDIQEFRNSNSKLFSASEAFSIPIHDNYINEGNIARPSEKRTIRCIVIHETGNFAKGVGAKNHANYLSNNKSRDVSWHYTVDDKEIYHHIPDNEVAYHAASIPGNLYSIGIELCVNSDGDFEKTFENATKLVAVLLKEYNLTIEDVKTHNYYSGKHCPHLILSNNRMGEFINKVEQLLKSESISSYEYVK